MSSKIEWTEVTVNTITGCTKYSEGCKNCYAEKLHKRLAAMGQEKYKLPFEVVKCHNPLTELSKRITKNVKMCFVNSMSDTFHKEVSDAYIYSLLQALGMYENVNFQILTKRASRLPDFEYPDNIWLGTTVELAEHKNRIEFLKNTNAKIKFLSCEPLLGDLGELDLSGIDWVIVGGESGSKARAMHPDWVRNIQKQCKAQNVAFFFKQWGEWYPTEETGCQKPPLYSVITKTEKGGKITFYSYENLKKKFKTIHIWQQLSSNIPSRVCISVKMGKKAAGSLLDGKEYKEYPKTKIGAAYE